MLATRTAPLSLAAGPAAAPGLRGTLVYSQKLGPQHDIFVSTDGGATSRNLTSHPADDTGARLSPDAGRVAFQSTRAGKLHLFVVSTAGGAATQLTSGAGIDEAPCWSADGRTVFFDSQRGKRWRLCAVSATGGPVTTVSGDDFDALAPACAPDGRTLACQLRRAGSEKWAIAVLSLEGVELKVESRMSKVEDARTAGHRTTAKVLVEIGAAGAEFNETPSFSPDGKWVYFAASGAGGYDLFRASSAGIGPEERLSNWPGWKLHPVPARGGTMLLFDEKTMAGWRLGALELGTGRHHTLPPPGPCFSPDWRDAR